MTSQTVTKLFGPGDDALMVSLHGRNSERITTEERGGDVAGCARMCDVNAGDDDNVSAGSLERSKLNCGVLSATWTDSSTMGSGVQA